MATFDQKVEAISGLKPIRAHPLQNPGMLCIESGSGSLGISYMVPETHRLFDVTLHSGCLGVWRLQGWDKQGYYQKDSENWEDLLRIMIEQIREAQ